MAGNGHPGRQGAWAVAGGDCRISGSIAGKPCIAPICRRAGGEYYKRRLYRWDDWWLCRYIALAIIKNVKVPDWARGLMPTLIVPFCLHYQLPDYGLYHRYAYRYLYGTLTSFLRSMGTSSNLVLGAVIGALCVDLAAR